MVYVPAGNPEKRFDLCQFKPLFLENSKLPVPPLAFTVIVPLLWL